MFFTPEGEELFKNVSVREFHLPSRAAIKAMRVQMTKDEHRALEAVRKEIRAEVKNGSTPTPDDFKAKIEVGNFRENICTRNLI